ncbi:MAG: hypothetical protein AB7E47_03845 [Desulfovibrionaceae bacterium]
MAKKPKIGFFDFAGCEGDQLQIANLEETLLDVLAHVEVGAFREVKTGGGGPYDVAFVEGSITRPEDAERLKEIRAQSTFLVALGACAHTGGINCMKNFIPAPIYRQQVYGDSARWYNTAPAKPLSAFVTVDAAIPGCPIDKDEFVRVTKELLLGKKPYLPDYPVCVECKEAGNICRFDMGRMCLGIITRAGCGACCVSEGAQCWGCRGLAPHANLDAARYVLEDRAGFSRTEVQDLLRMYLGDTLATL